MMVTEKTGTLTSMVRKLNNIQSFLNPSKSD
jgi:hypothetical protein